MNTDRMYEHFLQNPAVSTDSRKITPGCIFFALKGESFDGNCYAETALNHGAAYAVIDNPQFKKDERFILVPDSLKALQQLASFHRKKLSLPVIAITGSNGKTTTKELIRDVLKQKFSVQATVGNLNNHIGVPLTLLTIEAGTDMAIVEMGANHQGEIKKLCEIASPDYGIITNVGRAHLEGFGGFEGVKKAKGELYEYIHAKQGTIFINSDNEHLAQMLLPGTRIVSYGTKQDTSCKGRIIKPDNFLSVVCVLKNGNELSIQSRLFGDYNFENILAAVCIGDYFGVPAEAIKKGIEEYVPSINRSQIINKGTNTVYLDAYNANPTSMEKAIETFAALKAEKKIIVLGDMMELGTDTEKEHKAVVSMLKKYNFSEIILVGEYFHTYALVTGIQYFPDAASAGNWIAGRTLTGTAFLIKGSRKMKLETIVERIS